MVAEFAVQSGLESQQTVLSNPQATQVHVAGRAGQLLALAKVVKAAPLVCIP